MYDAQKVRILKEEWFLVCSLCIDKGFPPHEYWSVASYACIGDNLNYIVASDLQRSCIVLSWIHLSLSCLSQFLKNKHSLDLAGVENLSVFWLSSTVALSLSVYHSMQNCWYTILISEHLRSTWDSLDFLISKISCCTGMVDDYYSSKLSLFAVTS